MRNGSAFALLLLVLLFSALVFSQQEVSFPLSDVISEDNVIAADIPVALNENERVSLLYSSDDFSNPENYELLIARSHEIMVACFSVDAGKRLVAEDEIEKFVVEVLTQNQLVRNEEELQRLVEECKSQGAFSIPLTPLPFNISACRERFESELQNANVSYVEADIVQECLIEAHSQKQWLENGNSVSQFELMVQERIPLVMDLIAQRHVPINECIYSESGEEKCSLRNENLPVQAPVLNAGFVIEKFHFVSNLSEVTPIPIGAMETQVIVEEEYVGVLVQGKEVWAEIPLEVRNGKTFLGHLELNVLPEIFPSVEEGLVIRDAQIIEDEGNAVYEVKGFRRGKFLSLFPIEIFQTIRVDLQSNDVRIQNPWWDFLVVF